MAHTVRPLDASTWAAFAELVERNSGIFGGWCLGFHPERGRTGGAHAALVFAAARHARVDREPGDHRQKGGKV